MSDQFINDLTNNLADAIILHADGIIEEAQARVVAQRTRNHPDYVRKAVEDALLKNGLEFKQKGV